MNIAYIGLGSNIGPREEYLDRALKRLEEHEAITITKQSSIYETAPVEYTNQADFLNMVVEVQTTLKNMELLVYCQEIENELGRDREDQTIDKGPRTIDLDILMFNNENRDLGTLRIPHPRLQNRAFVLIPLNEIAADKVLPTSGKRVEDLLDRLPDKEIKTVVKWEK